jgi:hypothetical protein
MTRILSDIAALAVEARGEKSPRSIEGAKP